MSLASYQAPAGAGAVGVPFQMGNAMSTNMSGSSMPGPAPASGSSLPSAIGTAQGADSRGELCGDYCVAVDLFARGGLQAAIWGEGKADCSLLGDALSPVVGCTEEGKKLLTKGAVVVELLQSEELCVGSSGSTSATGGSMVDCYPLRSLADQTLTNSNAPSAPSIRTDSTDKSKDIDMPVDSSGAPLPLLLGLLLAQCAAAATDKGTHMFPSTWLAKGKKGKKAKKAKQSLTLVAPCGADQKQLAILNGAAEGAGLAVRNVFGRGVAAITGALFRSAGYRYGGDGKEGKDTGGTDLFAALRGDVTVRDVLTAAAAAKGATHGVEEPVALYLNLYRLDGGAGQGAQEALLCWDAALVRCEGAAAAQRVGSLLGFQRLCCVAQAGGVLGGADATGSLVGGAAVAVAVEKQLKAAVDQLLATAQAAQAQAGGSGGGVGRADVRAVLLDGLLVGAADSKAGTQPWPLAQTCKRLGLGAAEGVGAAGVGTVVLAGKAGDAASGATLLSAAELDSSKQYLQVGV
jgi:hypothetical protein